MPTDPTDGKRCGRFWFLLSLGEVEKVQFFGIGLLLLYVGFPFVCVGASSLLTKCVSPQVQGKFTLLQIKISNKEWILGMYPLTLYNK